MLEIYFELKKGQRQREEQERSSNAKPSGPPIASYHPDPKDMPA